MRFSRCTIDLIVVEIAAMKVLDIGLYIYELETTRYNVRAFAANQFYFVWRFPQFGRYC
jgi:hypothetical protein